MASSIYTVYTALRQHFGPMTNWWPIFGNDAPFEMLLGAILVQQTRWEAVEQAILRIQEHHLLTPSALAHADADDLAALLRPVAYYRQKAAGIIAVCTYLCTHYAGSTTTLLQQPEHPLRRELLALPRIGPETADVVLLYAGNHPVFVVDAYTRRLFGRIGLPARDNEPVDWERARYDTVQQHIAFALTTADDGEALASAHLPALYGTYHALINEQCVRYCLARRPRCDGPPARRVYSIQAGREAYLDRHDGCPLRTICTFYRQHTQEQA